MKKRNPALVWGLRLFRLGLCLVALLFLYYNVTWFDKIEFLDGPRATVLEDRGETLLIYRDGAEEVIPESLIDREVEGSNNGVIPGLRSVVAGARRDLLILGVLLFAPVPFLSSVRLVWMLAIQDVRLSVWNAVKLTFAGNFFNFALPGTTGGDLIKAYYITRFTHHKTEAITTVFLDRVIGLLGLMLVASLMFAYANFAGGVDFLPVEFRQWLLRIFILVWVGLIVGSIFVFSTRLRRMIGLPALAARLPAGEQLLRVGRATVAMRRHKGLLLASLLNTIVLQGLVIVSAFVLAKALGMGGDVIHYFIFVPIGFLIGAVPIAPPQGFGLIEAVYVMSFFQTGLSTKAQALALALGIRAVQLVWAIPGVLVPLFGMRPPTSEQLEQLESVETGLSAESSAP